ncbi:MAG: NAD(P)/FAD-dependent oxidoreductase [Cyanobacteria bacterium J06650_10]
MSATVNPSTHTTSADSSTQTNNPRRRQNADVVIIGSGLGGLVAGGLLARYGRRVIVCESHSLPGGAAHAFERAQPNAAKGKSFTFDSGPSFYCGLGEIGSANPIAQVLAVLEETIEAVPYEPFGYYHFPEGTLPVYGDSEQYQQAIETFCPGGGAQMAALEQRLLKIYEPLKSIPTLALRADLQLLPLLLTRYPKAIAQLLPTLPDLGRSMGEVMAPYIKSPWLKRLLDLECFLLSGMKCEETVAPEMAFMFGERASSVIDYPIGGSGALVEALVRGLKKWGGQLQLNAHVQKVLVKKGKAQGVLLKNGTQITAPVVISNATVWDTYNHLVDPSEIPDSYRKEKLETPTVDSFMHLHLGIRADGLEEVPIHHVVVHESETDITTPGNTCMVSIPTVLDPQQAPAGYHTVHAYTLEPFEAWQAWEKCKGKNKNKQYQQQKKEKAETLFRAVEKIIPDVRDRIELELIGTPLTHSRFLRRHKGTYGPAITAKEGRFPSGKTPIEGLHLVGDSTLPGIGVPAVAASAILCANSLVTLKESSSLLSQLD